MADQTAQSIDDAAAAMAAALGGGAPAEGAPKPEAGAVAPGPEVKKGGQSAPVQTLDFILDIPLKVTVELGRTKMMIRDILQLAQGSVVELSKFAGEPLEVLVNDKLVARGEVVVVNEKFGIRLTDIISPVERIEQLK
ncbi:MAG: flagellar motor switch protein FliN [Bdellovibrionota bacterium]